VGAGAIGCFFGSRLGDSGHEVVLVHHNRNVVAQIKKQGVVVREPSGRFARQHIEIGELLSDRDDPDVVILTVKAFDTKEAARFQLEPRRLKTTFLTLQNGLGNVEILRRYLSPRFVVAGSTTEGVTAVGPGIVNHLGSGTTWIGELSGKITQRCDSIRRIFHESGLRTFVSNDILGVVWLKAIVNSAINPISSLVRTTNQELLEDPDLYDACIKVVKEGMNLAKANGIRLPESPLSLLKRVLALTADNRSSMLQDIEAGRQTEIHQLNGILSQAGNRLGLQAPYNQLLMRLVRGLETLNRHG